MTDQIALGQVFDGDDGFRHVCYRSNSNEIRKAFFHLPKLRNAEPQKKRADTDAQAEAWYIQLRSGRRECTNESRQ